MIMFVYSGFTKRGLLIRRVRAACCVYEWIPATSVGMHTCIVLISNVDNYISLAAPMRRNTLKMV
jgi:plasmid replication initiation protein